MTDTTIRVRKSVKKALAQQGNADESMNDIIVKLLLHYDDSINIDEL